mmetsp:Transcript_10130/g.12294  ORF Transcript_10130/g.12294 Transcript_10130/m.12294 type:complete len:340 (-) Transcript_10130:121-1140(-)
MAMMTNTLFDGPVFGTMNSNAQNIQDAIASNYRAFDLAERYESQDQIGKALKDSKIPRNDLFLINKLDGLPLGHYADIKVRVQQMLEMAQVDYFDLLLIHYPLKTASDLNEVPSTLIDSGSWQFFLKNIEESWKIMTQLKTDGLVRHVGVSNFYESHIKTLLSVIQQSNISLAPISASQNFIDAGHPEYELVEYCQNNNIHMFAYRPLAFLGVYSFFENMNDSLQKKAEAVGCTSGAEFILAWLHCRGISSVSSSTNIEHIKSNYEGSTKTCDINFKDVDFIEENVEMIDMYGGVDEYAAKFKTMELDSQEQIEVTDPGPTEEIQKEVGQTATLATAPN